MVENIMYFAIGFLVASLFNLFLVPLVHNRAVHLTIRRLEASTPFSMTEVQAEKDQLRAEFAMSTRRLEMNVEQLKAKTTSQLGELGRQAMVIEKLKTELEDKSAVLQAFETQESTTRNQLRSSEQEYSHIEKTLAGKEGELGKLTATLNERTTTIDKQRLEIAALKTQIEQLRAELEHASKDVSTTVARAKEEREAAEVASRELAREHAKVSKVSGRIAQLESQLATQTAEAEARSQRVQELEGRLARAEADKLQAVANVKASLGQERPQAVADHAAAQANEGAENALLRERINDIAAEVTRLTAALEGPGSPIEAMLAAENTSGAGGTAGANGEPSSAPQGDLVERIRALKSRVSLLNPRS